MVYNVNSMNIPRAYANTMAYLRVISQPEESRLGRVRAVPGPFLLAVAYPVERVLFDQERDANPFFHLMEAIWMFSGEDNVKWLLQFNQRFSQYAERDGPMLGAYGFRWRYHFHIDQILDVVGKLKSDPQTRRAVIGMWDPSVDLDTGHNDYPCNTHIYFRNRKGALDMTVCNRSNDFVWGMLGSNAVHMTMLQELIARAAGLNVGTYFVFTNNLHIYESLPNFEKLWATPAPRDLYSGKDAVWPFPVLDVEEDIRKFFVDCQAFVSGFKNTIKSPFLTQIAKPMWDCWQSRKAKESVTEQLSYLNEMPENNDWRRACEEWILRRETSSSSTLTEPLQTTSTEQKNISVDQKESSGTSISPLAEEILPNTKYASSSDYSKLMEERKSGSSLDDQIPF